MMIEVIRETTLVPHKPGGRGIQVKAGATFAAPRSSGGGQTEYVVTVLGEKYCVPSDCVREINIRTLSKVAVALKE